MLDKQTYATILSSGLACVQNPPPHRRGRHAKTTYEVINARGKVFGVGDDPAAAISKSLQAFEKHLTTQKENTE